MGLGNWFDQEVPTTLLICRSLWRVLRRQNKQLEEMMGSRRDMFFVRVIGNLETLY